jgi:DNA repair protein RadA/Sms
MSKVKTAFFCQNCGYESVKWVGQCPSCGQWNSFVEELLQKDKSKADSGWKDYNDDKRKSRIIPIQDIKTSEEKRIISHDAELDRVLGGGIVPGSLVLVAGEPGIGKSTLFLQIGLSLKDLTVLYISGEESEQQIRMRADRLPAPATSKFYLLTETSIEIIFQEIKKLRPQLVIVDSIQTLQTTLIDSSLQSFSASLKKPIFPSFSLGISQRKEVLRDQRSSNIW